MSNEIWTPEKAAAAANQFNVNVGLNGNQVTIVIQYPNSATGCSVSFADARKIAKSIEDTADKGEALELQAKMQAAGRLPITANGLAIA